MLRDRYGTPVDPRFDERFMQLALAVGRRAMGRTWPNPAVGAVVVRPGPEGPVVIATGHTQPGGRPHAEAVALDRAGLAATGATLYVTLEPCSHRTVRGATPCLERSMAAGIVRVVSAVDDANPRIAGLSHAILRSTGVRVTHGVLAAAAARDHRGHFTRVREGRPMVRVKLAMTADGMAARQDRQRLKITGRAADARVHLMRARSDAILVGAGTAIADDPRLTVRLPGLDTWSPIRIVVDSDLGLAPFARNLIETATETPTWVITTERARVEAEKTLQGAGVNVLRVGETTAGRVDLKQALQLLGTIGITRVFCEGGPHLAAALARDHLVDELVLIRSPDPLAAPGEPAILPPLAAALAAMTLLVSEVAGRDEISIYERTA